VNIAADPTDTRHGTLQGYNFHKCRCDRCVESIRHYKKRWHAEHPEKQKGYDARWYAANRDLAQVRVRDSSLRRRFGMDQADYDAMLEAQGGGCAICGRFVLQLNDNHMPVDHDHETGVVRGILCHNCNHGLGHFHDDPDRMERAIAYLREHQ
jgi:hypothetical protein